MIIAYVLVFMRSLSLQYKAKKEVNNLCVQNLVPNLLEILFKIYVKRVLVMFHFMFVHYTFSSVWFAEWPPFGK